MLPGGSPAAALLHTARVVTRRAERSAWSAIETHGDSVNPLTATYLTQVLRIHWKRGADHFYSLLVDGDVANNYGNWQQIAGTGGVPRPARRINLYRQAERYDPSGDYVRRFVPELRSISGSAVHHPPVPRPGGYPPPLR